MNYRPAFDGYQENAALTRMQSRNYGLGMSDAVFAEQMAEVERVCQRGTFGAFATVQDWIDWHIHPAFHDEALAIVAAHEQP